MATDVTEGFIKLYSKAFELALQKKDSLLQMAVDMAGGYRGEKVQPVKRVGEVSFEEKMARLEPTNPKEPSYSARALTPRTWKCPVIFDRTDEFFLGFSPESALMEASRAALNRKKDEIIAGAFLANALTGKDGSTSTPFDTTNGRVAITVGGANTPINYEKIVEGKRILGQNFALDQNEQVFTLISWKQHAKLLSQLEVIEDKYKTRANIDENGNVKSLLGVNFITADFTSLISSTTRSCPMWTRSGMHMGTWDGVTVKVDDLPTQSYARQLYHEFTANAVRLDEKKVVEILAYET